MDELQAVSSALTLTLKARTKAELDKAAEDFLTEALEAHDAAKLVVLKKQMETLVDFIDAKLKEDGLAVNAVLDELRGSLQGEILGTNVRITYPAKWIYDAETQTLIKEHKDTIKLLENKSKLEKKAIQQEGSAVLTVTLKGGQ